jgi:hypothetical protein
MEAYNLLKQSIINVHHDDFVWEDLDTDNIQGVIRMSFEEYGRIRDAIITKIHQSGNESSIIYRFKVITICYVIIYHCNHFVFCFFKQQIV